MDPMDYAVLSFASGPDILKKTDPWKSKTKEKNSLSDDPWIQDSYQWASRLVDLDFLGDWINLS